jgi:hypothetical protein
MGVRCISTRRVNFFVLILTLSRADEAYLLETIASFVALRWGE